MAKRKIIKNYVGKKKGEQGSIFMYVGKTKTTYGYILELPPNPDGSRNKVEKGGFRTEFDAVDAKRKLEKLTYFDKENIVLYTFEEFVNKYFYSYLENVKKLASSTINNYKKDLSDAIEYFGSSYKLIDFKKTDRIRYQNYLINLGTCKSKTVNSKVNRVKVALDYAVYLDLISKNNFDGVNIKISEDEKEDIKVFTNDNLHNIFEEIETIEDKNKYFIPCIISLYTGTRIGETLALKWEDVDFEKAELSINKSLKYEKKQFYLGPTKNRRSRVLPIPETLLNILKQHKIQQMKNKMKLGAAYIGSDFVCTYEDGRLVTQNTIKTLTQIMANRCIGFNFHRFRHTFATNAVKANVNPKVLQTLLDHSTIETTMKYYVHVDMEQMFDASEKIAELSHLEIAF